MIRQHLSLTGTVQGVGFRPFVLRLAQRHGLSGWVLNNGDGVEIEAEGETSGVQRFVEDLRRECPPLARLARILMQPRTALGERGFRILASPARGPAAGEAGAARAAAAIPPDVGICADCERELLAPADRRYRYPFINCTQCGPRCTIVEQVPYDRPNTVMRAFAMCEQCAAEYRNPADRRFHAEPIACPACGPQLAWEEGSVGARGEEALQRAVAVLAAGGIIALKGLGGFHLACDAANGAAVRRLRERKERPCKPFALMSRSLDNIACYAEVSESERALLESPARPIVLLRQRPQTVVAPEVAPGVPEFGVMLAYTPLHMLLFETGVRFAALVMTSGNRRDEPLARTNDEARERLAGIADGFLVHDRDIHNRADDSIVRVVGAQVPSPQWGEGGALAPGEGATPDLTHPLTPRSLRSRRPSPHRGEGIPPVQVIRRARGFVPEAIPIDVEQSVFAAGAELKSSFCLTSPGAAVLSPYLGDLDDERTLAFYTETLAKYERLLDVRPAVVACDLHPDYLSTRCAETYAHERGLPLVRVQHHEAHVASVLAERGWRGEQPVLGVAFDGTGLGTDGRAWGGEFFLCADSVAMQRVAHLEYFPLPGGDVAAREVWRAALALLWQSGNSLNTEDAEDRRGKTLNHRDTETQRRKIIGSCSSAFLCVLCVEKSRVEAALRLLAADANCPRTSSVGRLFDAASVLAGLGTSASYEAEAAMRLEAACGDEFLPYPCVLAEGPPARILLEPLVRALGADAGNPARLAARFHATVGEMILTVAERCRTAYGARTVALSGGVFQNRVLTRLASSRLAGRGFEVWLNHLVPPNDGGLALGQAWLASQAGKVR